MKKIKKCLSEFWDFCKFCWKKGECVYCRKGTRTQNIFGEFFHHKCFQINKELRIAEEMKIKEDREQIELYKIAIKEVENEKM